MAQHSASELPQDFFVPCHAKISAKVTMALLPRNLAIGLIAFGFLVSIPVRLPMLGIPLTLALWVLARIAFQAEPYFLEVFIRHAGQPTHLEG